MSLLVITLGAAMLVGGMLLLWRTDDTDTLLLGMIALLIVTWLGFGVAESAVFGFMETSWLMFLLVGPFAIVAIPGIALVLGLIAGLVTIRVVG